METGIPYSLGRRAVRIPGSFRELANRQRAKHRSRSDDLILELDLRNFTSFIFGS